MALEALQFLNPAWQNSTDYVLPEATRQLLEEKRVAATACASDDSTRQRTEAASVLPSRFGRSQSANSGKSGSIQTLRRAFPRSREGCAIDGMGGLMGGLYAVWIRRRSRRTCSTGQTGTHR